MSRYLLSTAHFGPVAYYAVMMHAREVWIEAHESYQKQSYRNRCIVGSDQGPQALIVNVVRANSNQPVMAVRLSDHADWLHNHAETLATNYGGSPFYEYYIDELMEVMRSGHDGTLWSLNEALRRKVCDLIGLHPTVRYTRAYGDLHEADSQPGRPAGARPEAVAGGPACDPADAVVDLRSSLHPKRPVDVALPEFRPVAYYQVWGIGGRQAFMPNLSILDLLFNMGPEAVLVLRDSWAPQG